MDSAYISHLDVHLARRAFVDAHACSLVDSSQFLVSMTDQPRPGSTRGQFRVRLTKVNDM